MSFEQSIKQHSKNIGKIEHDIGKLQTKKQKQLDVLYSIFLDQFNKNSMAIKKESSEHKFARLTSMLNTLRYIRSTLVCYDLNRRRKENEIFYVLMGINLKKLESPNITRDDLLELLYTTIRRKCYTLRIETEPNWSPIVTDFKKLKWANKITVQGETTIGGVRFAENMYW